MAYKFFISYVKADADLAQDLARRLREAGTEVSFAKESQVAGDTLALKVARGLKQSDEVILLLTEHSINSPWVLSEAGAAFGLGKRITSVLVGTANIPAPFRTFQSVKYPALHTFISKIEQRNAPVKTFRRSSEPISKGAKNGRTTPRR